MFIATISPKCTQELQPTTKTTTPLAKHEAARTTLFPAGQLSMWGQRTAQASENHKAKCYEKHFCGISWFFTNVWEYEHE